MLSWLKSKPAKSPDLKEAESVFTDVELKALHKHFQDELARQAGTTAGRPAQSLADGAPLDVQRLGSLLGPMWSCLDPLLASQLQWRVADRSDGKVHLSGLIIAKARAERLGEQASLEFTYGLLNGADGKGAGYRALEAAVLSCLRLTGAVPRPAEPTDPRVGGAAAGPSPATSTSTSGAPNTTRREQSGATASSSTGEKQDAGSSTANDYHDSTEVPASGGGGGGGSSSGSGGGGGGGGASGVQLQVAAICRGALAHAASGGTPAAGGQTTTTAAAAEVRLSYSEYCNWTKKCPALHKTLCTLLQRFGAPAGTTAATVSGGGAAAGAAGGGGHRAAAAAAVAGMVAGSDPLRLPVLLQLGKLAADATLLQPVWVWALSSRLPSAQRVEWRLLFSSQRDGKSFNTFFGRVSAAPGPTLLLLRDKAARGVFGGYASQPWAKSGTYGGDVSSFIFSLLPTMQVFPATGINENFQWCGVGFSQLPGGLGFGGAAAESGRGHFALYVEPSLDAGMSRPIATYGNTPLASEQVFQIDVLECWLLVPPEEQQPGDPSPGGRGGGGGGGGSVLGKAAEDRAILELAGFKMHSQGMVDEPLEEAD